MAPTKSTREPKNQKTPAPQKQTKNQENNQNNTTPSLNSPKTNPNQKSIKEKKHKLKDPHPKSKNHD